MRKKAGCIPDTSREIISEILQTVIGHRADSIEPIKGIGMNNSVTMATTVKGAFVVRTNVESHLFRFQREAWCFGQLESAPVPTPQVIGCGVLHGYSYSVAPFIAGSRPIGDGDDQLRAWRTLGRYAFHLNQIRPPPIAERSRYFPATWEQQVATDVEIIFRDDLWAKERIFSAGDERKLRELLLGCAGVRARQGICQFDMTIANAVICPSDRDAIYLLDLEWANVAPVPVYQLACIAAEQGTESHVAKAFFEGYGHDGSIPDSVANELERFVLYRLMRATAWARDRYPTLVQENLERTRPAISSVLRRISDRE